MPDFLLDWGCEMAAWLLALFAFVVDAPGRLGRRLRVSRCGVAGHTPGPRDWVGRPTECARCGAIPFVDLGERASLRLYGEAARQDWNAEALRRMAWDEWSSAMAGTWPVDTLSRQLREMIGPEQYAEFAAGLAAIETDDWARAAAGRSW